MAVYSMTGYANAAAEAAAGGASVSVEARSVNGRFLDLALRLPDELRGLEPALRELLSAAFRRGKIELRVATSQDADDAWPVPHAEQLNRLSRLEGTVQGWLPNARPLSVNEVMQWCRGGTAPVKLDDAALAAARQCIQGLGEARAREGARLATMLTDRVGRLRELAAQAVPLVPAVVQRQQQRFLERWHEALQGANAAAAVAPEALRERALSEAVSYAIRIDVAE